MGFIYHEKHNLKFSLIGNVYDCFLGSKYAFAKGSFVFFDPRKSDNYDARCEAIVNLRTLEEFEKNPFLALTIPLLKENFNVEKINSLG